MRRSELGAGLERLKRGLASIDCVHSGGFSHQRPNSSLGSGKYSRKDRNPIDLHQTCINKAVPSWRPWFGSRAAPAPGGGTSSRLWMLPTVQQTGGTGFDGTLGRRFTTSQIKTLHRSPRFPSLFPSLATSRHPPPSSRLLPHLTGTCQHTLSRQDTHAHPKDQDKEGREFRENKLPFVTFNATTSPRPEGGGGGGSRGVARHGQILTAGFIVGVEGFHYQSVGSL